MVVSIRAYDRLKQTSYQHLQFQINCRRVVAVVVVVVVVVVVIVVVVVVVNFIPNRQIQQQLNHSELNQRSPSAHRAGGLINLHIHEATQTRADET